MNQNSGRRNPVRIKEEGKIRSENLGRDRATRSLFWDAVGSIVWLSALVLVMWAGSPVVVTGQDVAILIPFILVLIGARTYFAYRENKREQD